MARFRTSPRTFAGVWLVAVFSFALALIACSSNDSDAEGGARGDMRLLFVSHGHASDPFWSVVRNGVNDAASDLGVRVEYQAPETFDIARMAALIEAALDPRPSALLVTIPDEDALRGSLQEVVNAGIPVMSVNSGDEAWEELGLLGHIGQTEYEAGFAAGERLAEAGARRVLCVNHEVGNVSLDIRCRGLEDALGQAGGTTRVLAINPADASQAQQQVAGALSGDAAIDGVLTLGPAGEVPAAAALREMNRLGSVHFGTFDLGPDVLRLVRDGDILFAIDQLPYMQGYLAVTLMVKYLETGAMPGGGQLIRTGPAFVTQETAESVIRLTEDGRR